MFLRWTKSGAAILVESYREDGRTRQRQRYLAKIADTRLKDRDARVQFWRSVEAKLAEVPEADRRRFRAKVRERVPRPSAKDLKLPKPRSVPEDTTTRKKPSKREATLLREVVRTLNRWVGRQGRRGGALRLSENEIDAIAGLIVREVPSLRTRCMSCVENWATICDMCCAVRKGYKHSVPGRSV